MTGYQPIIISAKEKSMITRYGKSARMSQAVAHGGTLYVAGQVADNEKGSIEDQTKQVLASIDALLSEAGTEKAKILSINVYLASIADFAAMNSVYDQWVDKANPPARATVEASLATPDYKVEMTAIVAL
jgi:enamine deaminase RidA (YjgF/YER057c/UK114 family)